jgi:AcrR family transcriptional regulator
VIETGIECIAKYGFSQTSMQLISKEANISRGPLHYHFRDKNDLMGAIAEALPQQVSRETIERLSAAKSLKERMEALFDLALDQHLGKHHFVAIELLTAARRDANLAASVLPHFSEGERRIDHWWFEYGADLNWSESQMRAFRTVFVAGLRGLALNYSVSLDKAHHVEATKVFRAMLIGYVFDTAQPEQGT